MIVFVRGVFPPQSIMNIQQVLWEETSALEVRGNWEVPATGCAGPGEIWTTIAENKNIAGNRCRHGLTSG